MKHAISPTRDQDYPEWYQEVVKAADLAENSPVRGCMVIKPWGYSIWENFQRILDQKIKETGHQNAYFPLFIPVSYLEKEAEHVEGFAKECAVVTHHRLEKNKEGKLVPASELEQPLVVRPTSEMIIGEMFSKWVQSRRDLPILINQWANIVRWEMRTRMFLRTTEFLWQEGHTAHATKEEAIEETLKMLDVYADFAENYMAMPVIKGEKTSSEKFPGACSTYAIESMMQDGKALQAGTSHFLGQNFAKSCSIGYRSETGEMNYAWTTSWGVTTRLIGGLIMTHSDDDGLVLPPNIAPIHLVLIPVIHQEESRKEVLDTCRKMIDELKEKAPQVKVHLDERDMRGGEKKWHWIKKGVPFLVEVGPRDIAKNCFVAARRDGEKWSASKEELVFHIDSKLKEYQSILLERAKAYRNKRMVSITSKEELYAFFTPKGKESFDTFGGFALCYFCEDQKIEETLKQELGITARCIPLDQEEKEGRCIFTKKPVKKQLIFAKAY